MSARPRRNGILVGVPLYAPVSPRWLQVWEQFKLAFGKYERNAGLVEVAMSYVELAMNTIVRNTLLESAKTEYPSEALRQLEPEMGLLLGNRNPKVREAAEAIARRLMVRKLDYFLFIEADNVVPAEVIPIVAALDPKIHRIVGFPYVGRTDQDLRPIPGIWEENGDWHRLTYDEFKPMVENPGFHEVGSVGMGCTAIHRSVFEEWAPEEEHGGWFRGQWGERGKFTGHDIWFCHRAREQGHRVFVNTEVEIGHIGEYNFKPRTFLESHEFHLAAKAQRVARDREQAEVYVGRVGSVDPDTLGCLERSGRLYSVVELGPGTERHDLFAELWRKGDTFLSVEPDIVFRDGDLQELLDCPEPWCAFAGACPPFGYYTGLGCTKVTSELIARHPEAMEITGQWSDEQHPPKHWCRVDGFLVAYLAQKGESVHVHGPCEHRIKGDAPGHGCVPQELIDNPRPLDPPPFLRQEEVTV